MKVFTIGFTKKTAEQFFGMLRRPGLERLVDVRLNNLSQLAGFAKKDDLRFFVKAICGIEYVHVPELAPTQEMLDEYRKQKGGWDAYERQFLALLRSRRIEDSVPREMLDGGCLLCSEDLPEHCHRRLVAEYLREKWGDLEIEHIV
ncbi:MAG: DUF488 family protein [Bryobacteraceae bacterium]